MGCGCVTGGGALGVIEGGGWDETADEWCEWYGRGIIGRLDGGAEGDQWVRKEEEAQDQVGCWRWRWMKSHVMASVDDVNEIERKNQRDKESTEELAFNHGVKKDGYRVEAANTAWGSW